MSTTAFQITPRNSFSMLDVGIRELHDYCIEHKGSFCRYRKALYFWSLGISLYLELFCFLSFITIVLRNLCSGTHRRNQHKMKLNPQKCKEMYVSFMKNSITAMQLVSVGDQGVERVGSYKLLGVIISDDLIWNAHVEYVIAKAAKRLFALRLLNAQESCQKTCSRYTHIISDRS